MEVNLFLSKFIIEHFQKIGLRFIGITEFVYWPIVRHVWSSFDVNISNILLWKMFWLMIVLILAGNTVSAHWNLETCYVQSNFCSLWVYLLNSIYSCFLSMRKDNNEFWVLFYTELYYRVILLLIIKFS